MRFHVSIVLAAGVVVAGACKKEGTPSADTQDAAEPAGQTTAAATAPAMAAAAVTIASPARSATTGHDVTVVLHSQGVTIAKADGKKVDGVGHYHLFLDTIPTPDNVPIPPTTKKIVHIGTGDSTYTFKGLSAGPHTIIAVVGYGDHSPMPGRRDTVNFTVKP